MKGIITLKIIFSLLIIIVYCQVNAQGEYSVSLYKNKLSRLKFSLIDIPMAYVQPTDFQKKSLRNYTKMRNAGIFLTSAGIVASITGVFFIKKDNNLAKETPVRKDRSINYGFGVGLLTAGVTGTVLGVPILIVGNHKLKTTLRKIGLRISSLEAGVVYKF